MGEAAVHVVPPVAGEVLLVEDRAVGAHEAVLDEAEVAGAAVQAHVEHLAQGLGVRVVAAADPVLAAEVRVGDGGEHGEVHPRLARDLLQVVVGAELRGGRRDERQEQRRRHGEVRCARGEERAGTEAAAAEAGLYLRSLPPRSRLSGPLHHFCRSTSPFHPPAASHGCFFPGQHDIQYTFMLVVQV